MTNTTNTATADTIIDGITYAEHRELGRALYDVINALDKMEDAESLDELADMLLDMLANKWLSRRDLADAMPYPYPHYHACPCCGYVYLTLDDDGETADDNTEADSDATERSKAWHEAATLDFGMID